MLLIMAIMCKSLIIILHYLMKGDVGIYMDRDIGSRIINNTIQGILNVSHIDGATGRTSYWTNGSGINLVSSSTQGSDGLIENNTITLVIWYKSSTKQ